MHLRVIFFVGYHSWKILLVRRFLKYYIQKYLYLQKYWQFVASAFLVSVNIRKMYLYRWKFWHLCSSMWTPLYDQYVDPCRLASQSVLLYELAKFVCRNLIVIGSMDSGPEISPLTFSVSSVYFSSTPK